MDILERLKTAKKAKKMTLQQISDESGIPKRTVDDIFSGHTKHPRIDTLRKIEQALGLNSSPWTSEEEALGAGEHPTFLSKEEMDWLDLRSEVLRVAGEEALETIERTIHLIIAEKTK